MLWATSWHNRIHLDLCNYFADGDFFGLDALTRIICKLATQLTELKPDQDVLKVTSPQNPQMARTEKASACRIRPQKLISKVHESIISGR